MNNSPRVLHVNACLLLIEVERSECPHEQAVMMCCGAGNAGGRSDVHLAGLLCPREVARLLIMLYPVTAPETARPVMASGSNTTRVRVATHRAQQALHHGLAKRAAGYRPAAVDAQVRAH